MNVFRLVGDLSHIIAFIIVFHELWKRKSCAGISGKTQILFAIVFTTRYLDLATVFISIYNTVMKVVFLASSYTIIYFVYIKFRATYDYKHDSFYNEFLVLPAIALALLINYANDVFEIFWTFSEYLECVAILPQLFLAMKTKDAESFTTRYLIALTTYRVFYMQNWFYRYWASDYYDLISICAGAVQIAFYLLFFIYRYILKDRCVSGPQTASSQDNVDIRKHGEPLQSDLLVALHLGLSKGDHPYTVQQDSQVLIV